MSRPQLKRLVLRIEDVEPTPRGEPLEVTVIYDQKACTDWVTALVFDVVRQRYAAAASGKPA